jgi:hypothetical protein
VEFGSQTYWAPVCMRPHHGVEPAPVLCARPSGRRPTAASGIIVPSPTC